tara:strand:- start:54 stop:305 length:252 start_codon:yes stop_codon:yes gene_type:complete
MGEHFQLDARFFPPCPDTIFYRFSSNNRILSRELRELEAHKIINRKIFAKIPPRVEYSLTKKGRTLLPVFDKLNEWGSMHLND